MCTSDQAARDEEALLGMAQNAEAQGNLVLAGVFRAEAANSQYRMEMRKIHMPNLGPYTRDNPKYCQHCGKPGDEWIDGETCVPV